MKQGRWIAIGVCGSLIAIATGLLYLALSGDSTGSILRFAPYLALGLLAVAPLLAGLVSGNATPFAAGAGGLASGIAITVAASALNSGGTGVMPLTLGIAAGGIIGLRADVRLESYLRLAATALLAVYAASSGRLATLVFVYPLLGFADELADVFAARRRDRPQREPASTTTS